MRRPFIFVLAALLLMCSLALAQEKVKFNGQVRTRSNLSNKDFNSDTKANSYTELRTRFGAQFMPTEDVTGFIQLQDSRIYGQEPHTLASTENVDLHQAYFNIQNIFDVPFNLKAGRMELSYGAQRLIGAVGWHNVGRSFDGGVLQLNTKSLDVDFISARLHESELPGDSTDIGLWSAYGNVKMNNNLKLQPYIIGESKFKEDFSRYTAGAFLSGKHGAFSHEIELAYQFGTQMTDVDISAFMVTANFNYALSGSSKPALGVGVDYLSGDDGKDVNKYKVFSTLYATNHKFYGYMDYFLNIPVHTYGLGLMDMHIKAAVSPGKKLKLAGAFHQFNANADYTLEDGATSTSFGSEIDLTFFYTYNKSVKFQGGYSMFFAGDIFKETKGEDTSSWFYLMMIANL